MDVSGVNSKVYTPTTTGAPTTTAVPTTAAPTQTTPVASTEPQGPKLGDLDVLSLLLDEPDEVSDTDETEETEETEEPDGPQGARARRGVGATGSEATTGGVDGAEGVDDGISLPVDVDQLSEEEALAQGYIIIKTAEDLQKMLDNPNGKFILMCDIDLTGIDWTPIGTQDNPFTGELNGNGFTISGLTLNVDDGTGTENVGLFGVTKGATISNVILEDVTINTPTTYNKGAVGALIGLAIDTDIDNVVVSNATVNGHQKVGGLIGAIETGNASDTTPSITNVIVDATVNGAWYAGGLIGYVDNLVNGSLLIENTVVNGDVTANKKGAGGFIGEASESIITINNCTSNANVTGENGAERIGGFVGNVNGAKVAICNSTFNGAINAEGDFQGPWYGHYMNDAHVSIFELSEGLPVDDILLIEGIESLTPIWNEVTGQFEYEIAVSTITGLDKIVAMIRENPALGDIITFNVLFDFETMDGAYDPSIYAQYGVVQHSYEDENGDVVQDVYIDNEMDPWSTFHVPINHTDGDTCYTDMIPLYEETMIEGLYKDQHGRYYVLTVNGMTPVTLAFFFDQQKTNVEKRLEEDEVEYRDQLTKMVKTYLTEMRSMIKAQFGYEGTENALIIGEPEYEYLRGKMDAGEELSDMESMQLAFYELDLKISELVSNTLNNPGCGMGGDSSFLDETDAIPMYDENGNMRFTTLSGVELRQSLDEEGNPILDENGNPVYVDLDGNPYQGGESVFVVRGYPVTDEDGRFLFTDENGNTVYRTENEDGTYSYSNEDGSAYEGDIEALKQQLNEIDLGAEYKALEEELIALLEEYRKMFGEKDE